MPGACSDCDQAAFAFFRRTQQLAMNLLWTRHETVGTINYRDNSIRYSHFIIAFFRRKFHTQVLPLNVQCLCQERSQFHGHSSGYFVADHWDQFVWNDQTTNGMMRKKDGAKGISIYAHKSPFHIHIHAQEPITPTEAGIYRPTSEG